MCHFEQPKADAAFVPMTLRYEKNQEGVTEVVSDIAERFPVISKDGRTLALVDARSNVDVGERLYLVLLDVRTNKQSLFTLWSSAKHKSQQKEAQAALDKSVWQSLVPGKTVDEKCLAEERRTLDKYTVRFDAADFHYVGDGYELLLWRRSRIEIGRENRLEFKLRGLPGRMGVAAVPTNDVGGNCGAWAYLDEGWVTQDGKVYLFKFGAYLGGRCDRWPAPVEYQAWESL